MLLSCSRDLGPPRVQPLPQPDKFQALRTNDKPRSERIANYKIDATLDVVKHQITATQTVTWTNTKTIAVDRLPFHLYLNAFKNESSLFMRHARGEMRGVRVPEAAWGFIQIESIQVAGVELVTKLVRPKPEDPDETVIELPLPVPVEPKATIEVKMKFTSQLPEVFARTGYKGEFHLVAQWFPKLGVFTGPPGAERWECLPFHAFAEFFADFGTYDVTLTLPSTYVVAATGVLAAASDTQSGMRTLTYHARDVHDFAWMADPYMETISDKAKVDGDTVEVRVLFRPEQREFAQRHLEAAVGAVEKFSAAYVPYPWSLITIVDPPMDASGAAGVEYPTLVTTAGDTVFARPGIRIPELVTVHEVGHQWFQGMLASNEPVDAWLDEGVNEWAVSKVLAELYGPRSNLLDWMGWQADSADLRRIAIASDPNSLPNPIASAAASFVDHRAYGEASYGQTLMALRTVEQHVKPTKFAVAMKAYAKKFAFQHPTGRDLFDTLQAELGGVDLAWFFEPVFRQVGGMNLAIRTAGCWPAHLPRGVTGFGATRKLVTEIEAPNTGSFECEVVITNTGTIHVPIEIELRFEDNSTLRVLWDDKGGDHWERFVVQRSSRLAAVWIDPDDKVWLDAPTTHHYRLDGNGDASFRAAAWFAAVSQTLMQVIGP